MRRITLLVVITVLLVTSAFPLNSDVIKAEVLSDTILYVDPSSITVLPATEFTVSIIVEDVTDMMGFVIYLGFNSSVLDVLSVILKFPWSGLTGGYEINKPAGYVKVYSSLLGPPFVSGKSTLFTVTFNATARGQCALDLYDTILADALAYPIVHISVNGYVTVYTVFTIPDDYLTIQEAVNAAYDGDIIFIRNGTYYENIVVNKSLSILGESREETIVDGNGSNVFSLRTNNITISQFTIQNGYRGVSSNDDSWYCQIYGNNLVNNQQGILAYGWHWRISENYIGSNTQLGINVVGSYTLVTENRIIDNGPYGVSLYITDWNVFDGNTIADNTIGVSFSSVISFTCHNNTIYHNNFINNTIQVNLGNSANTTFDNGCEGNYWDDYEARYPNASCNKFGIWNTSYVIEGYIQRDNYPLRNLYWNPADTNHDLKVDIFDVVLVTSFYHTYWKPECCHIDVAEPYGIIDIFDIVKICMSYGEEYTP